MELLFIIIAAMTLVYLVITIGECLIGFNNIPLLTQQPTVSSDRLPFISIIFSALNEEENIEQAVTSFMQLTYPAFEVIAVNDRSTDKTAAILARLEQQYARLRVYHITELPENWLGKNHALFFASQHAKGEWLLFTDADVTMQRETLSKAISFALTHHLDHLTICEHHLHKHFWLRLLLLAHYVSYSIALKPWRIRYAWSKKSLGHGAFNLVSKKAYQYCEGHQAIAMECLDDLKLGELVKHHGFKQATVDGRDFIKREWYKTLIDMIVGWEKNSFAFYNYQLLPLLRDSILAVLFYYLPFITVIFFSGPIRWLNTVNICLTLYLFSYVAKRFRLQRRYAIFYPVGMGFLLYTIWNSAIITCRNKGITWRGTHYSLKKLKKQT